MFWNKTKKRPTVKKDFAEFMTDLIDSPGKEQTQQIVAVLNLMLGGITNTNLLSHNYVVGLDKETEKIVDIIAEIKKG